YVLHLLFLRREQGVQGTAPGVTDYVKLFRVGPEGHAKQAALLAAGCQTTGYASTFIIVVDDDIDPSSTSEVLWALGTRVDPESSIDVVRHCWGSIGSAMRTPEQKESGDVEHSVALVLACKPYRWLKQFPPAVRVSPELAGRVREKWAELFSSLQSFNK
ncbi:MAG: hypothetical protein V1849_05390, partial [Chloroflexota bacterium]